MNIFNVYIINLKLNLTIQDNGPHYGCILVSNIWEKIYLKQLQKLLYNSLVQYSSHRAMDQFVHHTRLVSELLYLQFMKITIIPDSHRQNRLCLRQLHL